jgi:hypothetical protein
VQISDQLDECCEGHSEQQARHTPQPAPDENPNRRRHRPDTHTSRDEFRNKKIRGYDMQEEGCENDESLQEFSKLPPREACTKVYDMGRCFLFFKKLRP